jgi:hypothetical protein
MDEAERPRRSDAPAPHPPVEGLGPGERPRDTDPGQRFAYEMAFDARFEGLRWAEAEPDLRAAYPAWAERHGYPRGDQYAWDRIKGRVRESWEGALNVERTTVDPRSGQWDERAEEFHGLWEAGGGVGSWEDYEPGYRYGYQMAFDPRFQGRPWADVEPGLQSGFAAWAASSGYRITDHATWWNRLRDGIREAWERATHRRDRGAERGKDQRPR